MSGVPYEKRFPYVFVPQFRDVVDQAVCPNCGSVYSYSAIGLTSGFNPCMLMYSRFGNILVYLSGHYGLEPTFGKEIDDVLLGQHSDLFKPLWVSAFNECPYCGCPLEEKDFRKGYNTYVYELKINKDIDPSLIPKVHGKRAILKSLKKTFG